MTTSLLVSLIVNMFSKDAGGSGIPQIKISYWKEVGYMKFKATVAKFVAGVLSVGGGNSVGPEGPAIYIGSGISSNLDGVFGAAPRQRRSATLIGAAAGLAAAFNTPLASITFVIEEIIGDMNNRYLGRVVIAAVIGAFTVHALLGRHPAFSMPSVENISWYHYIIVPIVALVASLAGVVFQRSVISWRGRLKKQNKIPAWVLPVIGGFLTWIIGCCIFYATGKIGIFGMGYEDLSSALNNNLAWQIAGVLVCGKLLTTIIAFSFGGVGGIFAPALFLGGLSGYFIAGLAGYWIPLTPADHIVLATVGMSACLGAIQHAPLTSMLIVFEMTHQFALVPGLMIGIMISQAISHSVSKLNYYEATIVQDGHELHKVKPPIDINSWQNLQISAVASPNPVGLNNLTEQHMKETLASYPYNAFPVFTGTKITGILTRKQIKDALANKTTPEVHEISTCFSDQTVKEVGNKFVESAVHVLIVLDRKSEKVKGIITLHDLIRAQAAMQT